MRLFILLFCLVVITSSAIEVQAQDSMFTTQLHKTYRFNHLLESSTSSLGPSASKDSVVGFPVINRLPLNYYSTHLGAACKMELRLEKQTGLPIRIRLGSKEQVDYLEGKFSRKQ